MTAVEDIVIDSGSGETEWWINIILVFFILLSLVSVLLGVSKGEEEEEEKGSEGR